MLHHVKALEQRSNKERVHYVKELLTKRGIQYECQPFRLRLLKGENIIVTDFCKSNSKNQLLITAHTNKSFSSPGANDNASGVSVLLKIAERLKNDKLFDNTSIKIIFFDHEDGLAFVDGSTYYAKNTDLSLVNFVFNLDMVGMGNSIAISPEIQTNGNSYTSQLLKILSHRKLEHYTYNLPPVFVEDHIPFMKRGVPSVSLNLFPKKDMEYLKKIVTSSALAMAKDYLSLRFNQTSYPMITMRHRHSDTDISEFISEDSLELCESIVMDLIHYHIKTLSNKGDVIL
ncbi:MAG: M28 family peptidase [bacterium]|nr:M28 family peptidase [bacterium]